MDAVIKIGGSIAETPKKLESLCEELASMAKKYSVVVVPGGGKFADVVRKYDRKFLLPSIITHRLAIIAMDQYGIVLSQLIDGSCVFDSLEEITSFSITGKVPIFLPSRLISQTANLEASWDVTSDSIAAFIAEKLKAKKLILVTSVDGIFTKDPKKNADARLMPEISIPDLLGNSLRTSVDKFLPRLLLKSNLQCYVVNGKYPQRISALLSGEQTICTSLKG